MLKLQVACDWMTSETGVFGWRSLPNAFCSSQSVACSCCWLIWRCVLWCAIFSSIDKPWRPCCVQQFHNILIPSLPALLASTEKYSAILVTFCMPYRPNSIYQSNSAVKIGHRPRQFLTNSPTTASSRSVICLSVKYPLLTAMVIGRQ